MQKILANNKNTFIFFLVLSFLFYGNSIKNGYSLDDSYVTVTNYPVKGQPYKPNNALVAKGFSGIGKIWHSHYGYGPGTAYDYRPLVTTMFAIEYGVFGQAPHINHFINVVLYALLIFYLFLFLKKCFSQYPYKESFAFICAILFLAHPLHTEVVNNIKCRDELMALLFAVLASMQIFVYFETKHIKHLAFAAIFMLLSLFTKFTSAIFIVLIPLTIFFFSKVTKKQIALVLTGLAACFFIYRRTRKNLVTEKEIRFFYHFENPLYTEHISFYAKILFALKTFGVYVKLLLFPYPLRFYYGSPIISTNLSLIDFEIILGIMFVMAALYYCYKSQNKIAFFGLLFFLLSIAPLINFLAPVAGIVGERLAFTGSIGFVVFITSVLFSLHKTIPNKLTTQSFTQKPLAYLSIVLILFLFYDWNRNVDWKSEFTLYEHDAQYKAKSAGNCNLLANKYYEMLISGDATYPRDVLINKSLEYYRNAFEKDSSVFSALNNAGVILFSYLNQTDLALSYFKRAIANNPKPYPQAYENLGNCYKRMGDFKLSFKNYRIATLQNQYQYTSYKELMQMLIEKKNLAPALPIIEEADKNFPKNYVVTTQYANYYLLSGQTAKGMQKLEEAFVISPNKKLAEYI
ncbi:MAG: hypothetical protein ABI388_09455, partial [Bacteroidia bacterium]